MDKAALAKLFDQEIYLINPQSPKAADDVKAPVKEEKEEVVQETAEPETQIAAETEQPKESVETEQPKKVVPEAIVKKKISFVSTEKVSQPLKDLLSKISAAVKVEVSQISITESISELLPIHYGETTIVFGDMRIDGIDNKTQYQILDKVEGTKILICHRLVEIASDDTKKRALWTNLQKIYKLN